jgi:ribosome maturation factor RimP
MSIEEKIQNLIEPALNSLGYELLRVKQISKDVIQILLDSENGINISDCTKSTKLIRNILHVSEIENYNLEVSSPGLDRPLIKPEHFKKFIGSEVKISTNMLIDGQKKFVGKLTDFNLDTNEITIICEDKIVVIDFKQMQSTNLYYK